MMNFGNTLGLNNILILVLIKRFCRTHLSIVPPHVQPIVAQQERVLVDVVNGKFDGGHDATADPAFGYAAGNSTAEREKSCYVNIVPLVGRGPLTERTARTPRQQKQ